MLENVKIVYVVDHYDIHLTGHAWYEDKYCYFSIANLDEAYADPTVDVVYELYELEGYQLTIQLANRKLFEDMVGYHWTYFYDADKHKRERGFTGGITDNWMDFFENPAWKHIREDRKIDLTTLKFLGKFKR